jgi:hypothetical protein
MPGAEKQGHLPVGRRAREAGGRDSGSALARLSQVSWKNRGVSMGRFSRKGDSSLSIERLLEESKEKEIIDLRKERLERYGFTEWKI